MQLKTLTKNQRRKLYPLLQARGVDTSNRDAKKSRVKVNKWLDMGFSATTISHVTTCSPSTIRNLSKGTFKTLHFTADDSIQRASYRDLFESAPDDSMVPTYPVQRMIQALQAIGHRLDEISTRLMEFGMGPQSAEVFLKRPEGQVKAKHFRAMMRVYDSMSMTRGSSNIVVNRSKVKGWAPPAAWDDITDPDEKPKGMAI